MNVIGILSTIICVVSCSIPISGGRHRQGDKLIIPTFSKDGTKIFYSASEKKGYGFYQYDLNTDICKRIRGGPEYYYFIREEDQGFILLKENSSNKQLIEFNPENGEEMEVGKAIEFEGGFAVSPGLDRIVFSSRPMFAADIERTLQLGYVQTGRIDRLPVRGPLLFPLQWHSNDSFDYVSILDEVTVTRYNVTTKCEERLLSYDFASRSTVFGGLSEDYKWIIYLEGDNIASGYRVILKSVHEDGQGMVLWSGVNASPYGFDFSRSDLNVVFGIYHYGNHTNSIHLYDIEKQESRMLVSLVLPQSELSGARD